MSRYVGVDLHRRRSVVVILGEDGVKQSSVRIDNSPLALADAVAEAGAGAEVVIEATCLSAGVPEGGPSPPVTNRKLSPRNGPFGPCCRVAYAIR